MYNKLSKTLSLSSPGWQRGHYAAAQETCQACPIHIAGAQEPITSLVGPEFLCPTFKSVPFPPEYVRTPGKEARDGPQHVHLRTMLLTRLPPPTKWILLCRLREAHKWDLEQVL